VAVLGELPAERVAVEGLDDRRRVEGRYRPAGTNADWNHREVDIGAIDREEEERRVSSLFAGRGEGEVAGGVKRPPVVDLLDALKDVRMATHHDVGTGINPSASEI
jgi:hypothetical protein